MCRSGERDRKLPAHMVLSHCQLVSNQQERTSVETYRSQKGGDPVPVPCRGGPERFRRPSRQGPPGKRCSGHACLDNGPGIGRMERSEKTSARSSGLPTCPGLFLARLDHVCRQGRFREYARKPVTDETALLWGILFLGGERLLGKRRTLPYQSSCSRTPSSARIFSLLASLMTIS